MDSNIPKKLHYCWFGDKPYSKTAIHCMKSWKKYAPGFEIYEWNEKTYNLNSAPKYVKDAFLAKKWAFVSDYVRLDVIRNMGGVYLDVDMELVKDISSLLKDSAFMGFEDKEHINNAIIGAIPHHRFIERAIKWYEGNHPRTPTPIVMTSLFESCIFPKQLKEVEQYIDEVKIYPHITFYPFTKETIKDYKYESLTNQTYAIHFWDYSWGNPLNKFFMDIGVYNFGKKISEVIGIKKLLKSIMNFE